jgi:hypothetical protein
MRECDNFKFGINNQDFRVCSLVPILLINMGFTSVDKIPVVKRNMEYFLPLISILPEVKNT